MANRTIDWIYDYGGGVPPILDNVMLRDEGSTYGVVRADNWGVVVPASTLMNHVAGTEFNYEFAEPVAGLGYRYAVSYEINGQGPFYDYKLIAPPAVSGKQLRKFLYDWTTPAAGGDRDGALSYRLEDADHNVLIADTNAYVFNEPHGDSIYEWYIPNWDTAWDRLSWVIYITDGSDTQALTNTGGTPSNNLIVYQDLLDRFGSKNVARTSNKDNDDKNVNTAAVNQAMQWAEEQIYAAMEPVYEIPLDFTPNGGKVPMIVQNWALNLAYSFLYEARGFLDTGRTTTTARGGRALRTDPVRNKVQNLLKDTLREMALYRGGMRELRVVRNAQAGQSATAISLVPSFQIRDPDERPFIIWNW